MAIEVFDQIEQGTPEWFLARAGIPTASEFSTVMASGRGGAESKTRKTYLYKLAGERITGEPAESFTNAYMTRGHALEPEARDLYALVKGVEARQVGFIRSGSKGCSPDSLVGDNGMLEIKTKAPHILIDVLKSENVPSEHVAQLQGNLWVAEREWIDFVAYFPKMPAFIRRVYRDEDYIAKLAKAVAEFNAELDELVAQISAMGVAA
jgi:hypothetical protein